MSAEVLSLTARDFDGVAAQAAVPLVVDFWAPWCGPCRTMAPVVDALAIEYGNRAMFAKVNVDENAALAQRFSVRSIPTVVVLRDGQTISRAVGAQTPPQLREMVDAVLGATGPDDAQRDRTRKESR